MNPQKTEKIFSLMRQFGVEYLKTSEVEIRMGQINAPLSISNPAKQEQKESASAASAPPVEVQIPHHENEVAKLLKLSDEDLVDRMFPEGAPINAES